MNSIKLTGLWKSKTQVGGQEYLSGSLTATSSLQIWPNKFKRNEKDPDFNLVIVQREKKEGDAPPNSFPSSTPPTASAPPDTSGADYLNSIPF